MKSFPRILVIALLCSGTCFAKTVSIPYFSNFDTGGSGWSTSDNGSGTTWQLGTPAFGITSGAFSGNVCWDVNLTVGYDNLAECYLYTPEFDFTGLVGATVSFYTQYSVEHLWDYMLVQSSVDGGITWNYLPFPNLMTADGTSLKWVRSLLDVSDLVGYPDVRFRFMFSSDATITYDGYSMDDFRIETNPLGIGNVSPLTETSIYPNPGNGYFNLVTDPSSTETMIVEVYDETGKPVHFSYLSQQGNTPSQLILDRPRNGNYFIRMMRGEFVEQRKVVVIQ